MPKKAYYKDPLYLLAFGKNLRLLREKKGFTQANLANDCGFEISQISRIERGKTNPSISVIHKIAKELQIKTKDLFDFNY